MRRLELHLDQQEECLATLDAEGLIRTLELAAGELVWLSQHRPPGLSETPELLGRLEAAQRRSEDLQSRTGEVVESLREALMESSRLRRASQAFGAAQKWTGHQGAFLNNKR